MRFSSMAAWTGVGAFVFLSNFAMAKTSQQLAGEKAIHAMTGCYLVDYNYVESEALMPGYTRDTRVYDVNQGKSVKEWIYAEDLPGDRIFVQHVLFAAETDGKFMEGSLLKHTGEDWVYNPESYLRLTETSHWEREALPAGANQWVRKITHLDDGPRYQCAGSWTETEGAYPEFSCEALSPIPGRETRDMGRKDYQLLQRSSKVVVYSGSWLERQNNVKLVEKDQQTLPLAKEVGKNWYVRLPDNECQEAQNYVSESKAFWHILRGAWDETLATASNFVELTPSGKPPRYAKIFALENKYSGTDLTDENVKEAAKQDLLKVIQQYRQ